MAKSVDSRAALRKTGGVVKGKIEDKLKLAEKILEQQYEMYRRRANNVKDRVVSFYRGYVRPMKRGKSGRPVEFGPKGALSFVGGFLFLDMLSHDNFSEAQAEIVKSQIENYKKKFKKNPPSFTADKLYGSLENREIMKKERIRSAFKALGKKGKDSFVHDRWFKKKGSSGIFMGS